MILKILAYWVMASCTAPVLYVACRWICMRLNDYILDVVDEIAVARNPKLIKYMEKIVDGIQESNFDFSKVKEGGAMSELILWEHHKKAICDFYACSDSHDRQYPDCNFRGRAGGSCKLSEISNLIHFLNEEQP